MKKLILALCLLLMVSVGAAGEEMQTETAPTVAEIALTMRPESEEPTHLTVGNSTKVSGSFFTTQFGNNTSDIDVRYMLHGYNPIVWMNQLEFTTDPMVVDSLESADTRAGRTYTIRPDLQRRRHPGDGGGLRVFLSAADLAAVCGPRRKHGRLCARCGL